MLSSGHALRGNVVRVTIPKQNSPAQPHQMNLPNIHGLASGCCDVLKLFLSDPISSGKNVLKLMFNVFKVTG